MTQLRKFILVTALALTSCFASQAITIDDFYKYCSKLPNKTEVKIPSLLLKLKNRHLSQLKVIDIEQLSAQQRNYVTSQLDSITVSKEGSIIRNNESDDEISYIYIQPQDNDKDITILITNIDDDELAVVYIRCNKAILNELIEEYND